MSKQALKAACCSACCWLSACHGPVSTLNSGLDRVFFEIQVVIAIVMVALGTWSAVAVSRRSAGWCALLTSWLLALVCVGVVALGTEGFSPWPGSIERHGLWLIWLLAPVVIAPLLATARVMGARWQRLAQPSWAIAAIASVAYFALLTKVTLNVGLSSGVQKRGTPTPVALPAMAVELYQHATSTCARLEDDRIYCWGAQREPGSVVLGNECNDGLFTRPLSCSDGPTEVRLPTTFIPARDSHK